MAKLIWDAVGAHFYETGVKNVVLYPCDETGAYGDGVAWNGVTAITESPSGAEATALYADDIKYLNLYSAEELGLTLEAYTYPDEFAACDGSAEPVKGLVLGQQPRLGFGLVYTTTKGNDSAGNEYGEKIHIVYGCKASPSERSYSSINDSPEAITFSWEITTTKADVTDYKPVSIITIDTKAVDSSKLEALKNTLYGSDSPSSVASLPTPNAVIAALK